VGRRGEITVSGPDEKDGERDGRADFDFFLGRWTVHNRRLTRQLQGSHAWKEFDATSVVRPILGGLGCIEDVVMDRASGPREGLTLHLYDPISRQWSLYGADSVRGTVQTPMVGGFEEGRGTFFGQETFAGTRIVSRFIWSDITDTSCRWEQAFSADGGATWETNWVMEFVRRSQLDSTRGGGTTMAGSRQDRP
jgi:hypothetical protein